MGFTGRRRDMVPEEDAWKLEKERAWDGGATI